MASKTLKTRILLKTDTTANWEKAANSFIPRAGEVCVYSDRFQLEDGTYVPGIKVGDGSSYINELEFIGEEYISEEEIDSLFVKLIKFYIGSKEYTCEEGMTWEVFYSSKYNDGSIQRAISGSQEYWYHTSPIEEASGNEIIIANKTYSLGVSEPT